MSLLDGVRAVAFDLDGTIVDSMGAFARIAADVMAEYHRADWTWAHGRYLETSGIPFFQQLELIFPGNPANAATAEDFERRKLAGFFSEPLFPGVPETLAALRGRGIHTAVSSNNFQDVVEEFVRRRGLEFDLVLAFGGGLFKGEPHFRKILETWALAPNQLLYVGDSLSDGNRALASGIPFVGRTGTFDRQAFSKAFPGIRLIDEIPELLGTGTGDGPLILPI